MVEEESTAKGAVVMEAKSGRILYAKDPDRMLPMASTTKIMTALVALEHGKLDDIVTVGANASGVEGSSLYLGVGERLTLEQLLYGLLLRSGNDAAIAIAEHIGGSVEGFVAMMNERAQQLGAVNTHFMNPNGLDAEGHYTTARDLALITAQAMKNPDFQKITNTQKYIIPWEGHQWDRVVVNKNKMLSTFPGANGGKTGFTKKAGRCLVICANREDMQLICVVLNCGPMFEESAALLDDCFNTYDMVLLMNSNQEMALSPVTNGGSTWAKLSVGQDYYLPLSNEERTRVNVTCVVDQALTAPVVKGQQVGRADICIGDQLVATEPLLAMDAVPWVSWWYFVRKMANAFGGKWG